MKQGLFTVLISIMVFGAAPSASAVDPNLIRDSPIVVAAVVAEASGPVPMTLFGDGRTTVSSDGAYRVKLRIDDCFKGDVPAEITVAVPAGTVSRMIFGRRKGLYIRWGVPAAKDDDDRVDQDRLKTLQGREWLWYLQPRKPGGSFLQSGGMMFAKGFPTLTVPLPQWEVEGTDYGVYPLDLGYDPEQLGRWDHDRTLPPYLRLLDLVVVNLCDSRKYQYWQDLGMLCPAMEAPNLSDYGPGALINLVPRAEQEAWFAKAAKRLPSKTSVEALNVAALRVAWGDKKWEKECFRMARHVGFDKFTAVHPWFSDPEICLWLAEHGQVAYANNGFQVLRNHPPLISKTARIALSRFGKNLDLDKSIYDWLSWAMEMKGDSPEMIHSLRIDVYQSGDRIRRQLKRLAETKA